MLRYDGRQAYWPILRTSSPYYVGILIESGAAILRDVATGVYCGYPHYGIPRCRQAFWVEAHGKRGVN
ncbi:MAG: hypothetical protein K0R08_1858 [Solimicrobium sp.]|nr:hypothetical protein [Solimicrobium sp.]